MAYDYKVNGKNVTKQEFDEYRKQMAVKFAKIHQFKAKLATTDYKAIKYAEGLLTEQEYAPIKAEREELRQKIRELEG